MRVLSVVLRTVLGTVLPLSVSRPEWHWVSSSPVVLKDPEVETDSSYPSSKEVRNKWSFASTSSTYSDILIISILIHFCFTVLRIISQTVLANKII